eukprot:1820976-Amphidinium_carterae.1
MPISKVSGAVKRKIVLCSTMQFEQSDVFTQERSKTVGKRWGVQLQYSWGFWGPLGLLELTASGESCIFALLLELSVFDRLLTLLDAPGRSQPRSSSANCSACNCSSSAATFCLAVCSSSSDPSCGMRLYSKPSEAKCFFTKVAASGLVSKSAEFSRSDHV